jgi:putative ABC transport system permease protein
MKWPWPSLPVGRRRRDEELDEEIRAHIAMSARQRVERGATADEARAAARREFGNVGLVKETTRDEWSSAWIERFAQDVRYGLRMMRRSPGFTVVTVLTLALGIGANTAIFSLVDAVMLRMLPVQRPVELVQVVGRTMGSRGEGTSGGPSFLTNPIWEAIRDRQDVFSGAFAWSRRQFDLAQGGEAQYADGLYVSGDYFRTLGVRPAAGRLLTTRDDVRGCAGAAILSYGFWQERYGGDQGAIGRVITLNDQPFQIVGVSAPGFSGMDVGAKFDVAIPLCSEAIVVGAGSNLDRRQAFWLQIIGRMKPGVSTAQVNARLGSLTPPILAATAPQTWKPADQRNYLKMTIASVPGGTGISDLRDRYDRPLLTLMAVVGLVLLIACANIASLLLARATGRRKEMSLRLAIGASRWRLIRQLLTECILLSLSGALLGILFARWGQVLLVRFISTSRNKLFLDFALDRRVLGFTAGAAVLTGLLFGVLPSVLSTRVDLGSAMKGAHWGGPGRDGKFRPAKWIVAGQIAMSLALLTGAGLFLRSFTKLATLDVGFDRTGVLVVNIDAHNAHLAAPQLLVLYDQILERMRGLPGVTCASQSVVTPISGSTWNNFIHPEVPHPPTGRDALVDFNYVSPDYFAALRTPLLSGREFNKDDTASSQGVAVVNEALAAKFFPGADAVGKYFSVEPALGQTATETEVVGIVKDAKYNAVRENSPPTAYFPLTQITGTSPEHTSLELRTAGPPTAIETAAAASVGAINETLTLQFATLQSQVDDSLMPDRLLATLSGFFGGLALLLAMIGLYGVLSYIVTQRKKEIGVRMAIGAGRRDIVRLVLRDVGIVLFVGCAAGVLIAEMAARFVASMLFGIEPYDVATIGIAMGLLAAAGVLAGYLPARRASRMDPMAVLREE